jgi:POT family proton-dependent oligopeptide transporter
MSAFLFMSAISSAVGEAFVSLSADPLLVWNYGTMAVISFLAGIGFWMQYRHLDRREDVLNAIGEGNLNVGAKDEEHLSTVPDPSKAGEHPARQTVDDVKS